MNWTKYHLSMDMDIGKNMARPLLAIDGFYSSPRSWILEQEASFVNCGIGGLQRSPNFGHVFRSYISPRTTHLELSNPCSASFLASQYLRHLFPYTGHLFRYLTNAVK